MNTKSINRLLENPAESDVGKYTLFRLFDSVLGVNLAVILSIADSLNAIGVHCIILKWFYEVMFGLLIYGGPQLTAPLCSSNNQTTLNSTHSSSAASRNVTTVTVLLEAITSVLYFILLRLASSHYFSRMRAYIESLTKTEDGRIKSINRIIYYAFFHTISLLILYLSISASSFKLTLNCEYFFKNVFSHSVIAFLAYILFYTKKSTNNFFKVFFRNFDSNV